jgi:transposase
MSRPLLTDEAWRRVEPVLPPPPPRLPGSPGRTRLSDRRCLTGILFVLRTGLPWEDVPVELGCGCGMTCWRRLREWQDGGAWESIRRTLAEALPDGEDMDWSRVEHRRARREGAGAVRAGVHDRGHVAGALGQAAL